MCLGFRHRRVGNRGGSGNGRRRSMRFLRPYGRFLRPDGRFLRPDGRFLRPDRRFLRAGRSRRGSSDHSQSPCSRHHRRRPEHSGEQRGQDHRRRSLLRAGPPLLSIGEAIDLLRRLPLRRLQLAERLPQELHLRLEHVELLDQLRQRFLLGLGPRPARAQGAQDVALALGRRPGLHSRHRVLELGQITETLAAVGGQRHANDVAQRPGQFGPRRPARGALSGEQLVTERAGGVDLHPRLALARRIGRVQLGRQIARLGLGRLIVERRDVQDAGIVDGEEPPAQRRPLRRRHPHRSGEEHGRLVGRKARSAAERLLQDVMNVGHRLGRLYLMPSGEQPCPILYSSN